MATKRPESMSSPAGSPAKTSPSPGAVRDSPASGRASGGSLPGLLAYFDPATSWWRTYQASLFHRKESRRNRRPSDALLGSWPASGMTRSGRLYRLPPLVPRTRGSGSSLSPTLRATETDSGCYQRDRGRKGKERPTLLGVLTNWAPTLQATDGPGGESEQRRESPNLPAFVAHCSPPKLVASDYKRSDHPADLARKSPSLPAVVSSPPTLTASAGERGGRGELTHFAKSGRTRGKLPPSPAPGGGVLNPRWCEWYMGFPVGWCEMPSED